MTVSHEKDSVVDLIVRVTASQELFSQNSIVVMIQVISGFYSHRYWLVLKELSQLSIGSSIVLLVTNILHVTLVSKIIRPC